MSAEWMLKTFTTEYLQEINNTAFIAGNHWAHRVLNEKLQSSPEKEHIRSYDYIRSGWTDWDIVNSNDFFHFESVFPSGNQKDTLHPDHSIVPHIVTDRAIKVGRESNPDRMIVHYELPHIKFIADAMDWSPGSLSEDDLMSGPDVERPLFEEEESYEPAKRGEVSDKRMYELYAKNLEFVLDYVEVLINNVEADSAVISADHGEGLGESGVWGHPFGCPLSTIKQVPWVRVPAADRESYTPQYDRLNKMPNERERIQFLDDMGYL